MATNHIVIATLSACLAAGPILAQNRNPLAGDTTRALAEAKMARARGEYEKADAILEKALKWAKGSDRARLLTESKAGSGSTDIATPTSQDTAAQDPVKRLIETINEGTYRQEKVKTAINELESLGNLAVPMLLEALPNLGPFGLRNALALLEDVEDPRIRPALEALCEKPNDAVVYAISTELTSLRREVALPLARRFSSAGWPAKTRFQALRVMARYDLEKARQLAMQLTQVFSLHGALLDLAKENDGELAKIIWSALAENSSEQHQAVAAGSLLLAADDLTQEAALAALEGMPGVLSHGFAEKLAERHPDWVDVGLLAVRTDQRDKSPGQEWFSNMEWWRKPTKSMAMLLNLPDRRQAGHTVRLPLREIIRSGWVLPEELQATFAARAPVVGWDWLLRALTPAGEARAIAVWRDASPDQRFALTSSVIKLKLPWHELVLLQMESAADLEATLFDESLRRSWHGMSADQATRFAALIATWQKQWPAAQQPEWRGRVTGESSNQRSWVRSLSNGYTSKNGIPSDVLLPLVRDNYPPAFSIMCMMDPERALQLAAGWSSDRIETNLESLENVLKQSGDARHIDLAIAVSRQALSANANVHQLSRFLVEHGKGDLRVIALGQRPGIDNKDITSAALRAAESAHISDRSKLIDLLPALEGQTAYAVLRSLDPQWKPSQAQSVLKLLDAVLANANNKEARLKARQLDQAMPETLAQSALSTANRLGATGVVERAMTILDAKEAVAQMQREAANVLLQRSGDKRTANLAKLLQHKNTAVIEVALVQPDLANDAGLRKLALTACLQHGQNLTDLDKLLGNLKQVDRVAFAKAIVSNPAFASISRDAGLTSLRVLGDQKDPSLVAAIAKGNSHDDSTVREMVAMQLGRTFAREAVPFLIDMLRDDSTRVRGAAENNLEQISNYLEAREKWQGRIK